MKTIHEVAHEVAKREGLEIVSVDEANNTIRLRRRDDDMEGGATNFPVSLRANETPDPTTPYAGPMNRHERRKAAALARRQS